MLGIAKCAKGDVGIVFAWDDNMLAKGINIVTGRKWESKNPSWLSDKEVAEYLKSNLAHMGGRCIVLNKT